jgi:hypothetical protein
VTVEAVPAKRCSRTTRGSRASRPCRASG